MKSLKIVAASLILAVGAITLSSFVSKGFNKTAFATQCFYYNVASLQKDVVGPSQNLVGTEFLNPANWTTIAPVPPIPGAGDCNNGEFLCAICYDPVQYPGLSLEDILEIALDYYQDFGTFPHNGDVDQNTAVNKVITVYRQSTTADHD